VSAPFGLGTAALAVPYGAPRGERPPPARAEARATIAAALAAGVAFLDTAPAYGAAEAIVGEVTAGAPCRIATKLAIPPAGWAALDDRAARDAVRRSAEASLRALRRDRLDVLQVHNADPALLDRGVVPAALAELRAEGVAVATGATTYGEEAALAAVAHPDIDVVQVALSPLDPRPERRVIAAAAVAGTEVVTRSALLRGVLSTRGRDLTGPFAPLRDAADAFRRAVGATWAELPGAAVAWCAARPGVAITLLGPRDARELSELLAGANRFAPAVRALGDGWRRPLAPALLDPSRWPGLEAAA